MSNIRTAIEKIMDGKPGEASSLIGNELLSRARDQIQVRKIEVATNLLGDDVSEETDEDDSDEDDIEQIEENAERNKAMAAFFAKGGKVKKLPSMHAAGSQTFSKHVKGSATSSGDKIPGMDVSGERADPEEAKKKEAEKVAKKIVKVGQKTFKKSGRWGKKRLLVPGKAKG